MYGRGRGVSHDRDTCVDTLTTSSLDEVVFSPSPFGPLHLFVRHTLCIKNACVTTDFRYASNSDDQSKSHIQSWALGRNGLVKPHSVLLKSDLWSWSTRHPG